MLLNKFLVQIAGGDRQVPKRDMGSLNFRNDHLAG